MTRPFIQINNEVRKMNDLEYSELILERQNKNTEQAEIARSIRNSMLSSCDWTQIVNASVNKIAWETYRQALRDIPLQTGFPWEIIWPTKP